MTIETHLLCSGHPLISQIIVSLADLSFQICITRKYIGNYTIISTRLFFSPYQYLFNIITVQ